MLRVFGGNFCAGTRLFKPGLTPFAHCNAALAIRVSVLVASEQNRRADSAIVRISIGEFGRRLSPASGIERSGRDGLEIMVLARLGSMTEEFYVTAFLLWTTLQMTRDQIG